MAREEVEASYILEYLNDQFKKGEKTRGFSVETVRVGGKDAKGCNWTPSRIQRNGNKNNFYYASVVVNEVMDKFNAIKSPKKQNSNPKIKSLSGKLNRNIIPDDFFINLDEDVLKLSSDVTNDQTKMVIAVEDTVNIALPQVWIYKESGEAARVDNNILIDCPINKVIWAENEVDIIFQEKEGASLGVLYISAITGVSDGSGVPERTRYVETRLSEVRNLSE